MLRNSKIHIAALAALASTAAFADSSITLYGTLDTALANTSTKNGSPTASGLGGAAVPAPYLSSLPLPASGSQHSNGLADSLVSPSFFGLKGAEDLGGGMVASFTLESYVSVSDGSTTSSMVTNSPASQNTQYNIRDQGGFWSKAAYVSLKTDYGMVRLGQLESLGYMTSEHFNPFGIGAMSPSKIFYTTDYYQTGWSNSIAYFAKVGDVVGILQYGFKGADYGAKWTAALDYKHGPLALSGGYEDNKAAVGIPGAQAKSWLLNASYDLSVVKLFAQYGFGKLDNMGLLQQPNVKSQGYQLGASIPVGAGGAVLASYSSGTQKIADSSTLDGVKLYRPSILSLAYDYRLSKRTDVYAGYMHQKSDYNLPTATALGIVSDDVTGNTIALGVRHSF